MFTYKVLTVNDHNMIYKLQKLLESIGVFNIAIVVDHFPFHMQIAWGVDSFSEALEVVHAYNERIFEYKTY